MVLIILNEIKFEATKFETRTMPTPDMKGKEIIYWIKVDTTDRRLVTDLQRFLGGSAQYIELKVPSAFIGVRTELEGYKAQRDTEHTSSKREEEKEDKGTTIQQEEGLEERYSVEIVLRRQLPETKTGQMQAPYG